jgi:hypothetical protein
MLQLSRGASTLLATAVIGIVIIGYVVGHSRSQGAPAEKVLTASAGNVLLTYPVAWRAAVAAPEIKGLAIAHPLVLAPGGDATQAGLVAGALGGGEAAPLPRPLIALMRALPETAVVDLLGSQAYRYAHVNLAGFDRDLTLYAIPNPSGEETVLACYATASLTAYMRTCEHIVASLALLGQSQTYDLTPNPSYARELSASVAALDQQRSSLRREMAVRATTAAARAAATRLASAYAGAATSISKLEPPSAASAAQATLTRSILQASAAYKPFATAVAEENATGLTAARKQVDEAETGVQGALEEFALLGYQQA